MTRLFIVAVHSASDLKNVEKLVKMAGNEGNHFAYLTGLNHQHAQARAQVVATCVEQISKFKKFTSIDIILDFNLGYSQFNVCVIPALKAELQAALATTLLGFVKNNADALLLDENALPISFILTGNGGFEIENEKLQTDTLLFPMESAAAIKNYSFDQKVLLAYIASVRKASQSESAPTQTRRILQRSQSSSRLQSDPTDTATHVYSVNGCSSSPMDTRTDLTPMPKLEISINSPAEDFSKTIVIANTFIGNDISPRLVSSKKTSPRPSPIKTAANDDRVISASVVRNLF